MGLLNYLKLNFRVYCDSDYFFDFMANLGATAAGATNATAFAPATATASAAAIAAAPAVASPFKCGY